MFRNPASLAQTRVRRRRRRRSIRAQGREAGFVSVAAVGLITLQRGAAIWSLAAECIIGIALHAFQAEITVGPRVHVRRIRHAAAAALQRRFFFCCCASERDTDN